MARNITSRQILAVLRCWLRDERPEMALPELHFVDDFRWVAFSSQEKLAPPLAAAIESLQLQDTLPPDLNEWLRVIRANNADRNRLILLEIKRFTQRLNAIGIEPCFLKGAAHLLDGLYEEPGDRFLSDVDCLLFEADIPRAQQELTQDGNWYEDRSPQPDDTAHAPPLFSRGSDIGFELHRKLSYIGPLDEGLLPPTQFLKAARRIEHDGMRYRIPITEHRIAHLLAHASLSPSQLMRGSLYLRDLIDLDLLIQLSSPEELQRALSHFAPSPLARLRAGAAIHAAHRAFSTPVGAFPVLTATARALGHLAVMQSQGPGVRLAGRTVGMGGYLILSLWQSPASFRKTIRTLVTQLREDVGQPERD